MHFKRERLIELHYEYGASQTTIHQPGIIMSKSKDQKKMTKKEPSKTPKEKKEAKKLKKEEKKRGP
jgi:hypothetical protein